MKLIIEQLKKVHMVIKWLVLSFLLLLLPSSLFFQTNDVDEYCFRAVGKNAHFETIPGKLYAVYTEKDQGVVIRVINSSDRYQFLFSSYFDSRYHESKYLHRIDKGLGEYKLSFLPLLPYLSTKPTDKQIIGSERVVNKGQVLYDFVELVPNSYYDVEIKYNSFDLKGDLVCDFRPNEASKFEPIKFKYVKLSELESKLSLVFEFAVYQDVDLLCKESAYYLQEHEFDSQAKAFKIVSVPVKFENYDHPLF